MMRHTILVVVVGIVLIATPRLSRACVCPAIEPDTAYQNALLVFTGTVTNIIEHNRDRAQERELDGLLTGAVTRFTVDEYFKGAGGPEVEIRSGSTSCDISFLVGGRYVVYASRNGENGSLGAFSCSRTKALDDYAKPDLSYLRRVARGELPSMLYGFVFRSAWDYSQNGGSQPQPLGDLAILVEGNGRRVEMKTDRSGYFEIFGLPLGSYRIRTGVTGKLRGAQEKSVELSSSGVVSVIFQTTSMGSASGRLVDAEGNAVREIAVELLVAANQSEPPELKNYVSTQEDGTFVFNEIPAGQYILAVNSLGHRSLYKAPFLPSYFPKAALPGKAQVLAISEGVSLELGDFVLQRRYPTVPVSGTVIGPDGKPVSGAYVELNKSGGDWDAARAARSDAEGRFIHQVFEGFTYTLYAYGDAPTGGTLESERVEISAGKRMAPVRLVVKPPPNR